MNLKENDMNYFLKISLLVLGSFFLCTKSFALTLTLNPSTIDCGTTTINGSFDCAFTGTVVVSVSGGVELDAASPALSVSGGNISFDLIVEATDNVSFNFSGVVISSNLPCAAVNSNFSTAMTHTCILPPNNDCSGAKAVSIGMMTCNPVISFTDNASDSGVNCDAFGNGRNDLWYEFVSNGSSVNIELVSFPGTISSLGVYEGSCTGTQVGCAFLTTFSSSIHTQGGLTVGETYYVQVKFNPGDNGTDQEVCLYNSVVVALDENDIELNYNDGEVEILWEDQSNIGQHYEIYRSQSSELYFEKIGELKGKGQEELVLFQFSDSNIEFGDKYFYKVIKLDENGDVMYEAQESIYIDDPDLLDANSIMLYPNPSNGEVNVFVNSSKRERAKIEVIDLNGKVCHSFYGDLDFGENRLKFLCTDLQAGIYSVSIEASSFQKAKKLIKN